MAETKAPAASYLAGEDPATIEANRRYQEALAKLTESLDSRKNRFFDPVMLAAAEGFLGPSQGGGFFEGLGRVAAKLGPAEAAKAKEEQDIAQQRVAVAGQGVELQRLKQRDAALNNYLNPQAPVGPLAGPQAGAIAGPQAGPLSGGEAPAAAPTDGLLPTGALSQAAPQAASPKVAGSPQGALASLESNKPPGFENIEGIQVMPPNPDFMTARDYIRLNRSDKNKSAADLIKEAQEINQKRYRDKEGGVQDLATGKFYQFPTGKTEEITIEGYPGTHKVDARVAARLSWLALNDDPAYHDLAKRVMSGPRRRDAPKDGEQPTPTTRKSMQEMAVEQKEAETRAGKLGEEGAKKEAAVSETASTARRVFGNVTRVADYVNQSSNYFGIFARPGITAAIGNLVREGIQTPSGSLNIAGFENSVRQMMPGVTQKDLDNVTKAATELAELELSFTRLYLAQQGAVTEGERKIVRAIPGTTSNSPEVLRTRMELLKSRSQYDIDVADAFRQWQDKNPGRSYLEFERRSELYKDIKKEFEEETERIFGGIKAVPTNQRQPKPSAPAAGGNAPSSGYIKDPVTGVNRRKKPGE
jgi:hypothetical protein